MVKHYKTEHTPSLTEKQQQQQQPVTRLEMFARAQAGRPGCSCMKG